jgi:hypothetical protein
VAWCSIGVSQEGEIRNRTCIIRWIWFNPAMSEEGKAVDIFGIKGLSDSVKIVTQGAVDGAAALLGRICLPAAEEFGGLLRDKVSKWRGRNSILILNTAEPLIQNREAKEGALKAPAQVVYRIIEYGSWSDDSKLQRMWAGLLASSCTSDGTDETSYLYTDLISRFSPVQARLFDWIAAQCPKVHDVHGVVQGDHFNPAVEGLLTISRLSDVNELDSQLSVLFGLGLFHQAMGGSVLKACKGLSSLGVSLYMRLQGVRGNPKTYFKTALRSDDQAQHQPNSVSP